MSTLRAARAFRELQAKQASAYLRTLGYRSDIFSAAYRGGTCKLSTLKIHVGDPVAYFRDFGLCHAASIEKFLFAEREASRPACACGNRPAIGFDQCRECVIAAFADTVAQ